MAEIASSPELARVVEGITAFVTDFDGPATAHVGGTPYLTLCSQGVKPQGHEVMNFGWQEAVELYGDLLREMVAEHKDKQLAWRTRPQLRCHGEARYHVYSRLAFI